ncbi:SiaB family protein kinase [Geofilum sp. OHC36d9]|uniref:SiaB family protein kinase n=1 Tax=Geofilum sp. OHC36d9 TaxID=3458413 RepID=UPI00403376C9
MKFDLNKWYLQKINGEIIYKYSGSVTSDKITESLSLIEDGLDKNLVKGKIRKKVYNVVVECIQNLYHYADIPPLSAEVDIVPKYGLIVLSKDQSFFRISTGNFFKTERLSRIEESIKMVNSLSDEDIVVVYRDILVRDNPNSGGSGLGFLDMVRKTGNKLEYYIYPQDEKYSFLSLDVYIS